MGKPKDDVLSRCVVCGKSYYPATTVISGFICNRCNNPLDY